MKRLLAPKQVPLAMWLAATALALCAAFIAYPRSPVRVLDVAPDAAPASETAHILQVKGRLGGIKERLAVWGTSTTPAAAVGPGGSAGALIALASPLAAPGARGGGSGATFGSADASLIVMQVGRRVVTLLDGQPVHVGQTLASGEVVQALGPTFVVLKSLNGEPRRIDMKDRFMRRAPSQAKDKSS